MAVLRLPASRLPTSFHLGPNQLLDPAFALTPDLRLQLQARLSRNGEAMPQPGDVYSQAVTVSPRESGLALQLGSQ
ncbi:c-type cytochrome biogenesis protein CcmI/CycH [Diaphorobacter aerolatus]